jgi:hypothetical protein
MSPEIKNPETGSFGRRFPSDVKSFPFEKLLNLSAVALLEPYI